MEKRPKRKFNADFKAKVVIEALRERNTIEDLARKYELHPNQISTWKKEFLEKAAAVFQNSDSKTQDQQQQDDVVEKLYSQIGQLKVENDWLKKKLL
jgi:transposase